MCFVHLFFYIVSITTRMLLTFNIFSSYNDFVRVVLLVDIQLTVFTTQLLQNTFNLHFGVFLQGDQNERYLELKHFSYQPVGGLIETNY